MAGIMIVGLPESLARRYVAMQQAEREPTSTAIRRPKMAPFKTIHQRLADWRRYRETVRELSQLSDRNLDDIGVSRNDIEHIVRHSLAAEAAA
jgi:uncharacterized protein YjiS (DUF1127 family)